MTDLSIVIVSWNTRELLRNCLASVDASLLSTPALSCETFVVDNASSDASAQMVKESFPQATLIETGANLGFAGGNNIALRRATGRWLLLLNSDTLVPEGALAALVALGDSRPDAVALGPLLLNGDGSVQHNWARFPSLASELSGALDRSQSPYPIEDFDDMNKRAAMEPFACDWVGGACLLVRASAATGERALLDEGFFMYAEETEWCLRLKRAGGQVLLVPTVTVTHLGGGSARAVPRATRQRMWRSSLRFYKLAYGPLGALPASLVATARMVLHGLKHRRAT